LPVVKNGNNTFIISNAKKLATIRYKVEDSFDANLKKDKIFEPAGTNIEAGKNYIFNNAGFFGFAFYLFDQCWVIGVYQAHDFFQIAIAAAQHLNRGPDIIDACINQQLSV
jgi:hypothetical protein